MAFYFNATLIALLISNLACFVVGLISLIRGYTKKRKEKISRGWRITILGLVMTVIFALILFFTLKQEMEYGEEFLSYSIILILFFLPFALIGIVVCLIFFLGMGITSLKAGYTRNEEGKLDTENIVLGYLMLVLGVIVIFSIVMYVGATMTYIGESIHNSIERRNSSLASTRSQPSESLSNYLFSIIYK